MSELNTGEITMEKICFTVAMVFVLIIAVISTADAQTAQETLNQYIADLQKNPNGNALREKIIRHVQTMKSVPAIPAEAQRYMARGQAAVEDAKSKHDYSEASKEFQKAVNTAPWWADAYYNLGITHEKAEQYPESIISLKFYMLAAPNAQDLQAVNTKIFKLEYRMEKASKTVKLEGEWTGTIDQPDIDKYGKRLTGNDVYKIETDGANVKINLVSVTNVKPYSFFGNMYNQPIGQIVFKLRLDGSTLNGTYFQPFGSQLNPAKELSVSGEVTSDWNTIVLKFKESYTLKDARGTLIETGQFTILTMKRS